MSGEYFEGGYPPPAFYFTVTIGDGMQVPDASFSEVSGISIEMETEAVVEGGENRFVHQLPKSIKHPNLELKRGLTTLSSPLVKWCKDTLEGAFIKPIEPKTIVVKLNGAEGEVLRAWALIGAYPVKWDVEGFNATKNEVAIEKMTFAYTYSKRSK
ncbi:phage tail protein [Undibacterium cyanobacteriorum]|uniref:Phage tail protein n=1 Tax=Undibacterium cyanobacteriorum TaxID=3073561 RepID=A0ABY9RIL2_9BURK|nr:phage tail protein [Undibacterium sp. 20NA77.5]WMW80505.1 phage tail protein [Undibacterium sp. 20NA77.5]